MTEASSDTAFDILENAIPDENGLIELPLVTEYNQVLFPYTITPWPMDVDEADNKFASWHAIEHKHTVIHAHLRKDANRKDPLMEQIHKIGTEAAMVDLTEDPAEQIIMMMAQGRRRLEIVEVIDDKEELFPIARARLIEEVISDETKNDYFHQRALDLFNDIADITDVISDDIVDYLFILEDDAELSDIMAATIPLDIDERQKLLDEYRIDKRLEMLCDWLKRELAELQAREDINNRVKTDIEQVQREVFLREQMRVIQSELGEGDDFEQDVEQLKQHLLDAKLPEEAQTKTMQELKRLSYMSPLSQEAGVIRTYLEWFVDLPWEQRSRDNLNLSHAEKTLNKAHYGLEKVKERVLEHIAVRKLAKDKMRTPIICFVGPPGVGKTSLGKSIAEALGRKFVRVSLGGLRDEAEIRGHRRTYIGSMPGRIIQTMKRAGTVNPVFMLDEIDKMTEDYRGDPASALLEVLDPEQNNEFTDHYLEVPYDLSDILFIATANELYPLPEALADRMEIIEFNGYTEEEKLKIAQRFLLPKQLLAHGLSRRGIQFQEKAILHIIQHYTLEAGVRNLERELANVCRKITKLAAMKRKYPKRITPNLVEKYLGPPYIIDSHLNREDLVGITTGLVWTSGGGDIQIIEASLLPGKGSITLTGQLGDVLQESAQIAQNYVRWRADDLDIPHDDFDNYDVHLHMPEGAVPKDGPSAGITLAIALLSIFTESKIRSDWAMTGEVTLRGHVLAVGGVKEKVLAARRRGIKNIILPADNEKDLVDIPKNARRDLNILFVKDMQEVMDAVLLPAPAERQRDLNSGDEPEDQDNE